MSDEQTPKVFAEVIEFGPAGQMEKSMLPVRGVRNEVSLEKDSQQIDKSKHGALWASPRVPFKDLLYFLDTNVWHKRSVYLKAALVAGLGWELVTDDENKDEDRAFSEIMQLLTNPNPNPLETFSEICFRARVDYEALGNLFIELPRNLKSYVTDIYHVRAKSMRRDKSLKKGYWQIHKGSKQEFRAWGQPPNGQNEILHHYAYDPTDSHYGIPEWYPALADMVLDRSEVEYWINLFYNQMVAKFVIVVEGGKLSQKGRENLQEYLSKNFHGIKNAGRTLILDSDTPGVKIRIEKLEVSFDKNSSKQSSHRTSSRDNVIAAHGIPPRLMSIVESGSLGGGSEVVGQLMTFKETVVDPEQRRFEDVINNTILASFGDHKWRVKFKEFNPESISDVAEALSKLTGANIFSVDESREYLGKPALEDGQGDNLLQNVVSLRKRLEGYEA